VASRKADVKSNAIMSGCSSFILKRNSDMPTQIGWQSTWNSPQALDGGLSALKCGILGMGVVPGSFMVRVSCQVADWKEIEDAGVKLVRAGEFKASGNSLFGRGRFRAAAKWYAFRCDLASLVCM